MILELEPCLPQVVVVIFAAGTRPSLRGHFANCVWRTASDGQGHEVAIDPNLFEQPEELLATMLHEAAHALLHDWGLNGGCGEDGYYHRVEFRNVCRRLGLECDFSNRRYGWNRTRWPVAGVPERYGRIVVMLRQELPWGRNTRGHRQMAEA